MIRFITGNLLESDAEALVNTVNTVGVMGKGIALQFKEAFPENYRIYRDVCKAKEFNTGTVLVVKEETTLGSKYIVNFPTKAHWKGKSKYEYLADGLIALKAALIEHNIKSIAIPPLGCGNGGLDWTRVKAMIETSLKDVSADVIVYQPNAKISTILRTQDKKKEVNLTPARAMLLYLLFRYEALGEQSSLFVANKLAYFLQRSGEKLRLKFEAHHYGPYSVQLNHVFLYLNDVYLKGLEQNTAKPFDPIFLNYEKYDEIQEYVHSKLSAAQQTRLHNVLQLVQGFQSAYSLELLASVDYINDSTSVTTTDQVMDQIASWSKRKTAIFKEEYVQVAMDHLKEYSENPF
jgi:O-acetyl-ADP-ribose deacetylase (regulator of RNase III)/uncharacterized protein YwgA